MAEGLAVGALVIAAAAIALYRKQDVIAVVSWVAPAALLVVAVGLADSPVSEAISAAIIGWLFVFSFSERIGQWWWRHVLRRPVARGALPAADNYATRFLEAAVEPAWREHRRYLEGRSDAHKLRTTYVRARADLNAITPPDGDWADLLRTGRSYLDAMIGHLQGNGSDVDTVHSMHDAFRNQWEALLNQRRRAWQPREWF